MVSKASRKGGPLITFAVLGIVWVGARAMFWESPLPFTQEREEVGDFRAAPQSRGNVAGGFISAPIHQSPAALVPESPAADRARSAGALVRVPIRKDVIRVALAPRNQDRGYDARYDAAQAQAQSDDGAEAAMGHTLLWRTAMQESGRGQIQDAAYRTAAFSGSSQDGVTPAGPAMPAVSNPVDRWSLDVWGFFRQGSMTGPISQGRVPTYGASQSGAKLTYRLAPQSGHDPRLFVRAYQALIADGEREAATGASARPFPKIPVRLAGEMRVTDGLGGLRFRPAGYAFTEFAPISLPARFSLEAYGQAGYVGGANATPFADGQATIMRDVYGFSAKQVRNARISVGGGIWGGAQRGASRVDIGPSVRVDMNLGKVPMRMSVDWRQKIAGDAAPESGVTATVSTRF